MQIVSHQLIHPLIEGTFNFLNSHAKSLKPVCTCRLRPKFPFAELDNLKRNMK